MPRDRRQPGGGARLGCRRRSGRGLSRGGRSGWCGGWCRWVVRWVRPGSAWPRASAPARHRSGSPQAPHWSASPNASRPARPACGCAPPPPCHEAGSGPRPAPTPTCARGVSHMRARDRLLARSRAEGPPGLRRTAAAQAPHPGMAAAASPAAAGTGAGPSAAPAAAGASGCAAGAGVGGAAAPASAGFAPALISSITASSAPTSTVMSSCTLMATTTPPAGAGILCVHLVGADLQERLVGFDALAFFLEPPRDGALRDALAEAGHRHRHGHLRCSFRGAWVRSSGGRAARELSRGNAAACRPAPDAPRQRLQTSSGGDGSAAPPPLAAPPS